MPNLGALLLSLIPGLTAIGTGVSYVVGGALLALVGLGGWLSTLTI